MNYCEDINCNGICEWDNEQVNKFDKASTRTVQTESVIVDGATVETGWYYWLIQKTKDHATETDFQDFGDEVHCVLKDNRSGRVLGERVYMKGIE